MMFGESPFAWIPFAWLGDDEDGEEIVACMRMVVTAAKAVMQIIQADAVVNVTAASASMTIRPCPN